MFDFDDCNVKFLQSVYPHQDPEVVADWYWTVARKCMKKYNSRGKKSVYCINVPNQHGGGREVFEFEYRGRKHHIGVISTDGRDVEGNDFKIFFVSTIETRKSHNCGYIIKYAESNVAEVNNLNNQFPCTDGVKIGSTVLAAIVDYCRTHKESLGIDELELNDKATYQCPVSKIDIHLLISNQLQERLPYYMEHGFEPADSDALEKIRYNINRMKKITLGSANLIELIKQHAKIPKHIEKLITDGNPNLNVASILTEISAVDCDYYSVIYQQLFIAFGLQRLDEEETVFRIVL